MIEMEGRYTFQGASVDTVLDDIYPALVERFEDEFEDAELQCYDSENGYDIG